MCWSRPPPRSYEGKGRAIRASDIYRDVPRAEEDGRERCSARAGHRGHALIRLAAVVTRLDTWPAPSFSKIKRQAALAGNQTALRTARTVVSGAASGDQSVKLCTVISTRREETANVWPGYITLSI